MVDHKDTKSTKISYFFVSLCLCGFLLFCAACQSDAPPSASSAESPTRYEGNETPQIANLIESGSLKVGRIAAIAEKVEAAEPFGEIVTIGVKNETGQELFFRIDCGTVLRAVDARYQDLVVTRSAEAKVAPFSTWTGKLEVFSIELERLYPVQPAEYRLGRISSGDMRQFVECFCFHRPEGSPQQPLDLTPVQYAIWRIADNVTLKRVLDYARQKGKPTEEELAGAERKAREQGRFAEQLLEDCRITVKFLD
jgi:hypothetical protein